MKENKMLNDKETEEVRGGAGKVYVNCSAYSLNDLSICHMKIMLGECCGSDCIWHSKGMSLPD